MSKKRITTHKAVGHGKVQIKKTQVGKSLKKKYCSKPNA